MHPAGVVHIHRIDINSYNSDDEQSDNDIEDINDLNESRLYTKGNELQDNDNTSVQ
eukprot:Pgem_evm1s4340